MLWDKNVFFMAKQIIYLTTFALRKYIFSSKKNYIPTQDESGNIGYIPTEDESGNTGYIPTQDESGNTGYIPTED